MFTNIREYRAALSELRILSELQPSGNSPLGTRISLLLQAINQYEKELFIMFQNYLRGKPAPMSLLHPNGKGTVVSNLNGSLVDYVLDTDFGRINIDLYASGDLKEKIMPGDTVEFDWSHPYLYIAHDVRKISDA